MVPRDPGAPSQWCRSLRDPLPSRRLPLWRPPTKPPGRRQLRQQSLGTWKQQMAVARGIPSGWIDVYPSMLGFKNCRFRSKIGRGKQIVVKYVEDRRRVYNNVKSLDKTLWITFSPWGPAQHKDPENRAISWSRFLSGRSSGNKHKVTRG